MKAQRPVSPETEVFLYPELKGISVPKEVEAVHMWHRGLGCHRVGKGTLG